MIIRLLYNGLIYPFLRLLFFLLSFRNQKIREGLRLRKKTDGQWPWLGTPARSQPIWLHCASFEFEYAKPVIAEIKTRRPSQKILVTYFSPSVRQAVEKFPGIDFAVPSPWDQPKIIKEFLHHHQPRALLIARTDTWPEMLYQTAQANIPSLLFSATINEGSGRLRTPALTRWSLSHLRALFCVTVADQAIFARLGLGAKTQVAGDTRFDQVLARLQAPREIKTGFFKSNRPLFVYGSTWIEDEDIIIDLVAATTQQVRHVIVPHEPTPEHLHLLQENLKKCGLTYALYSQYTPEQTIALDAVLVVDQLGILAELYALAHFAFVGGSFRKTVHSVMEPLAAGALTFVGPYHENNREALEFKTIAIKAGLTAVQPVSSARQWQTLLQLALQEFHEPEKLRVREEVQKRSGQSVRVVDWLEENSDSF